MLYICVMIKEKIKEEIKLQGFSQVKMIKAVENLKKDKKLTQPQLSYYLSGKGGLPSHHIESLFEILGIVLIRIL